MKASSELPSFATLLQDYFSNRLVAQRNASPNTIAAYRDTFRLLLRRIQAKSRRTVATLGLSDLDVPVILDFLDHLERDRHSSIRSRNARLAALKSFFHYVATRDPTQLSIVQRVLAIPSKRHNRPVLGHLNADEMKAIQSAASSDTWSGRRDHVMIAILYNTGARVSELVALQARDFVPGTTAQLHLRGKGRKERRVPLWRSTTRLLSSWLSDNPGTNERPMFPNRQGQALTRSGVAFRLQLAVRQAAITCPSLRKRTITPHTLRHTTAMHLLQAGVDITVIALWLGHESPATTHGYVEADLDMKKRALDRLAEPTQRRDRFTPSDSLLAFLDSL
jgi:integrase/recombinase XerD